MLQRAPYLIVAGRPVRCRTGRCRVLRPAPTAPCAPAVRARFDRLGHVHVGEVPRRDLGPVHLAVVLLGVTNKSSVLSREEELVPPDPTVARRGTRKQRRGARPVARRPRARTMLRHAAVFVRRRPDRRARRYRNSAPILIESRQPSGVDCTILYSPFTAFENPKLLNELAEKHGSDQMLGDFDSPRRRHRPAV